MPSQQFGYSFTVRTVSRNMFILMIVGLSMIVYIDVFHNYLVSNYININNFGTQYENSTNESISYKNIDINKAPTTKSTNITNETKFKRNEDIISNENSNIHQAKYGNINEVRDISNETSNAHEEVKRKYEKRLMFLNVTTGDQMITKNRNKENYSIDVLTVGSMYRISAVEKQFETWGSHPIIRNFFLATEYDDPDPNCHFTSTLDDVKQTSGTCKSKNYWAKKGVRSILTDRFAGYFARIQWLEKKKKPAGWICAQKRFISAFTKLINMYTGSNNTQKIAFPDYLVIVDDDTYINIDHIKNYLLTRPNKKTPLPSAPVIFSGCRVRWPNHEVRFTFPWGGFGTFMSKGSLQRWTQPINCLFPYKNPADDDDRFERNICNKYKFGNASSIIEQKYPFNATIGEEIYFQNGYSLNDVFFKYIREEELICLHSDWFFGYFANFFNISIHVNNHFSNSTIAPKITAEYFDKYNHEAIVPENRLHAIMNSDIYRQPGDGLCENKCHANATICHDIKEESHMQSLYKRSRAYATNETNS